MKLMDHGMFPLKKNLRNIKKGMPKATTFGYLIIKHWYHFLAELECCVTKYSFVATTTTTKDTYSSKSGPSRLHKCSGSLVVHE